MKATSATHALELYNQAMAIHRKEYVQFWIELFESQGFVITDAPTETYYHPAFSVSYLNKKGVNYGTFDVFCHIPYKLGVIVTANYNAIKFMSSFKRKILSEAGVKNLRKMIDNF